MRSDGFEKISFGTDDVPHFALNITAKQVGLIYREAELDGAVVIGQRTFQVALNRLRIATIMIRECISRHRLESVNHTLDDQ